MQLHQILIRAREEFAREYSTLQAMQAQNDVGLSLDYRHFWSDQLDEDTRFQELEHPEIWRTALGQALAPQGSVMPVVSQYRAFPWAAVAGHRISTHLEPIFSDRYFMASGELNLLNTILLEDGED